MSATVKTRTTRRAPAVAAPQKREPAPARIHPHAERLSTMQGCFGNRATGRMVRLGAAGDAWEREADGIADEATRDVMPGETHMPGASGPVPRLQRKCSKCEREDEEQKLVQAKSCGCRTPQAAAEPDRASASEPLPDEVRAVLEERLGYDFGGVRVHTDGAAAHFAGRLGARAVTSGKNIYFGAGEYDPRSRTGIRLLAHELVHVIQQTTGGSAASFASRARANWQAFVRGGQVRFGPLAYRASSPAGRTLLAHEMAHAAELRSAVRSSGKRTAFEKLALLWSGGGTGLREMAFGIVPALRFGASHTFSICDDGKKKPEAAAMTCDQICAQAYGDPNLNGGGGGVVCYRGTKCACSFDLPFANITRGDCPAMDTIIMTHENRHLPEAACDPARTDMYRAGPGPGQDLTTIECTHRRESITELDAAIPSQSEPCKTRMTNVRASLQSWVDANC